MKLARLALSTAVIALLAVNAQALQVDEKSNTNSDGSAKLADPDDKVPYPHFDDNGTLQSKQGMQLQGNGDMITFGGAATPPSSGFNRAVDNQK